MKRRLSRRVLFAAGALALSAALAVAVFVFAGPWFGWSGVLPSRADIAYASESKSQKLDLYLPAGQGPFPVVVYVHGGAFRFGDKQDIGGFGEDIRMLNARNIALASINYRMSGEAPFPAAVLDAKAAVRYLRRHAQELGLDGQRIGIWGKSAGANLALMVALSPGNAFAVGSPPAGEQVSDAVQVAVAMYAPTDFLTMDAQAKAAGCSSRDAGHDAADSPESRYVAAPIQQSKEAAMNASPISHVNASAPPVLLQAGTSDCVVPYLQSQELFDALLPVVTAERVRLTLMKGWGHGDSRFDGPENLSTVGDFLTTTLRGSRAPDGA